MAMLVITKRVQESIENLLSTIIHYHPLLSHIIIHYYPCYTDFYQPKPRHLRFQGAQLLCRDLVMVSLAMDSAPREMSPSISISNDPVPGKHTKNDGKSAFFKSILNGHVQ